MSRRVVVTGVGLLCSVGSGTDECWQAVCEGRSGIGPITQFDPTAFNCRIAGEVKNFDPDTWIEKKEIKKMGALHPVRDRRGGYGDEPRV